MYSYPVNYSAFRNEELMYLAARMNAMLPDNQLALAAELRQRGLHVPDTDVIREFHATPTVRVEVLRVPDTH